MTEPDPEAAQAALAARLRAARATAGLSQQQVAERTGILRSALSDIERGVRRVDALELASLAGVYGQPLEHLLGAAPAAPSEVERLVQTLDRITDNVHGYLAQRAHELAQPIIAAAKAVAEEQVRVARAEELRQRDLADELRRQFGYAVKRAHRAEHRLDIVHSGGECADCDARRADVADVLNTPTSERNDR